jgi:tetratricopeptide (TPR) repeat protein
MQLREQLVAQFPNEPTHRYDLTVSQLNTTAVMLANREYREAETLLRACLGQLAAAPDSLRVESEYRRSLAASHLNLGIALENLSKPEEATAEYEQGIRVLDELMQTYPRSIPLRTMLIDGLNNRFRHQVGQNQMAEALEAADRVMQLCRQLNEEFPDREDFAAGLKKQRELVERIRQLAPKPDGAPTPASSTER